jgi:hypothetical protein
VPENFQRGIEHVVPGFSQILIALRQQADLRCLGRPSRVGGCEARILQPEQMEFHFQPGPEVEPGFGERIHRIPAARAARKRNRLAVAEIDVAQHPARLVCPRKNTKGRRIGDHQEVASALHLGHGEAAAGGEYRIDGTVRGILGEQRCCHRNAGTHRTRGLGCEQGLATQHPVLVGEGEAHNLQLFFLDDLLDLFGGIGLRAGPQTVAIDKT